MANSSREIVQARTSLSNVYSEIVLRHAPWSISKAGVLNLCGKQYLHKYVEKLTEGKKSDSSRVGVVAHAVLEAGLQTPGIDLRAVLHEQIDKHQLSREETIACSARMSAMEDFITRIGAFKESNGVTAEFIEHQLAISPQHTAVPFKVTARTPPELWQGELVWLGEGRLKTAEGSAPFPPLRAHGAYVVVPSGPFEGAHEVVSVHDDVLTVLVPPVFPGGAPAPGATFEGGVAVKPLLRGVIDHAMRTNDDFLIVLDHKSGKKKPIGEHSQQFYAYMALAVVNFPWARGVQSGIHYIGEPKVDWFPRFDGKPGAWTRDEIFSRVIPWLEQFIGRTAVKLGLVDAGTPRAETGWQCSYCGFSDHCEAGRDEIAKRARRKGATNI